MVRSSSLAHAAKSYLSIERDDGEHILLRVRKGTQTAEKSDWLVYRFATRTLKDVSSVVENDDIETAFSGEYGKRLIIDRRFAYSFDQCRQRRNIGCNQPQKNGNPEIKNLSLRARGRVISPNQRKTGKITLYSVADTACPISQDMTLKTGTALKIYHDLDNFYFVRHEGLDQDFITGWILKDHVGNINFLTPPASAQSETIEVKPALKPIIVKEEPVVSRPFIESEFDTQQLRTTPVAESEEVKIPVPVMIKPDPSSKTQTTPSQERRTRPAASRTRNRRDG